MANSVTKSTKLVCAIALVSWCIWAILFVLRILCYSGIAGWDMSWANIRPITWYPNSYNAAIAQWSEIIGYVVTNVLMLLISLRFICTTLRGLNSNEVFTRSNARSLMWLSVIIFFHTLFADNIDVLHGSHMFELTSGPFTCTIITLIVAMLYRLAVNASEENRLTI